MLADGATPGYEGEPFFWGWGGTFRCSEVRLVDGPCCHRVICTVVAGTGRDQESWSSQDGLKIYRGGRVRHV